MAARGAPGRPCGSEGRDRYIGSGADFLRGAPVFAGTWLTVYTILGRLLDGDTVDDLAADYPELSREAITAAAETESRKGEPW